ncbi:peroxiredoxin family protein [Candidatus Aenigmatarchaeota archaeon]
MRRIVSVVVVLIIIMIIILVIYNPIAPIINTDNFRNEFERAEALTNEELLALAESSGEFVRSIKVGSDVGDIAPDFVLPSIRHDVVKLSEYREIQNVILFFWEMNCEKCTDQLVEVQNFVLDHEEEFSAIAVNTVQLSDHDLINQAEMGYDITYYIVTDPFREIKELYNVNQLPTIFIIDKDGIIVGKSESYLNRDDIKQIAMDAELII